MNDKTDDLVTRFLLGELSAAERREVELRFLTDDEFFERILAREDSLLDECLLGRLGEQERARAEVLFQASPAQKRDWEFTRDLISLLADRRKKNSLATADAMQRELAVPSAPSKTDLLPVPPQAGRSPGGISLAAIAFRIFTPRFRAAVAMLLCLSLIYWVFRLYSEKNALEAQRQRFERSIKETTDKLKEVNQRGTDLAREIETERQKREQAEDLLAQLQSHGPAAMPFIVLSPTPFERGGNSKAVTLKLQTKRIQLRLAFDPDQIYSQYNVMITTFDGRQVWSRDSIPPIYLKQGKLNLSLPSSLFEYEDYRIELKGLAENGTLTHLADYTFKVRK